MTSSFKTFSQVLHEPAGDLFTPVFNAGLVADYFKLLHGDKFVYCNKKLYFYDGEFWDTDDANRSMMTKFVDIQFYQNMIDYGKEHMRIAYAKLAYLSDMMEIDHQNIKLAKIDRFIESTAKNLRNFNKRRALIGVILIKITNNEIELDSKIPTLNP